LAITWSADSLYACGPFFARCRQARWSFVVTFKEGRLPDLWREFQALLRLVPNQGLREQLPDRTRRLYRWIEGLAYVDSEGRPHTLNALLCEETLPPANAPPSPGSPICRSTGKTVLAVANQGGRLRSTIENEGFNVQKNSGLNLEHAYSLEWSKAKAYYLPPPTGTPVLPVVGEGQSLARLGPHLRQTTVARLWGGQDKLAQRLLEALRYFLLPDAATEPAARISFVADTS
jgi:hypothetical protein